MSWWLASSDLSGARVSGTEIEIRPGPTAVTYPTEPNGTVVETDDGAVVHQQPNLDGRRRQWTYKMYPKNQRDYQRVWPLLWGYRSRYLLEAGLSPYCWIKEDVTDGIQRRFRLTGTATATGFTVTTSGLTPNLLVGGVVIVAGQLRAILANDATTISVGDAFLGSPSGAMTVMYTVNDFFRARVLEVSRTPNEGGAVRYEETRFVFVIDDPNSRDLLG